MVNLIDQWFIFIIKFPARLECGLRLTTRRPFWYPLFYCYA